MEQIIQLREEMEMADFFEIDFLDVECKKSGDAITMRYNKNGVESIHVIDGGFVSTGDSVVAHIKKYYGGNTRVNRVVVTHPDGDHAGGLRAVLEQLEVDELWMLRPWQYSDELIERFKRWTNTDSLTKRLKEIYPNIAALEEIALQKNIPIYEPFQGENIGDFKVLAPSKESYLNLVSESERTPETVTESNYSEESKSLSGFFDSIVRFIKAAWGDENLSSKPTSNENEMSVVQFSEIDNQTIMFTGDAGKITLTEAIDYLEEIHGGYLPKIDRFQVPHHGSRRNVSSEILDRLFGKKIGEYESRDKYTAVISSAKEDKDHPRKAVIRAFQHRGAKVIATEGKTVCCSSRNAPQREGWSAITPMDYPVDQEE